MTCSTNTEIPLDSFKDKNKLSNCSRNIEDEGEVIDVICVTENFAEVFNLSLMKGRFFDNSDCNSNDPNMPVPVILGNDYADSYEVGDIIEFEGARVRPCWPRPWQGRPMSRSSPYPVRTSWRCS